MTEPRGATDLIGSFAALCADERAFRAWYDVALPRVYGFIYARAGGDTTLADDILATAFTEAIRARDTFDGRADPVTWICTIARNRLIDHYRREARDRARHLRVVVGDLTTSDGRQWETVDARDAIQDALASLAPLERTALLLRYRDGYSIRETARLIGRSEGATASLVTRARDRVRAAYPGGLE